MNCGNTDKIRRPKSELRKNASHFNCDGGDLLGKKIEPNRFAEGRRHAFEEWAALSGGGRMAAARYFSWRR
jgi:hypothetical protein